MMKAKIAAAALLMSSSTAASAVERIDFTGTANRGARTSIVVNDKASFTDVSYNDTVSGSISFDPSASGVTFAQSISGENANYIYYSQAPGFISYNFASSGVNPSPSGALVGGYVQFTTFGGGLYEFRLQGYSLLANPQTFDQNNRLLTTTIIDNSLQVVLTGYADLATDSTGKTTLLFSRLNGMDFYANDANFTIDYTSDPNGVTNGTQTFSSGTIGQLNSTLVAAVPEPATWAMLLIGFGMICGATRYRGRGTLAATTEG